MHHFSDHKEFFNKPVLIGNKDPLAVIYNYSEDSVMYEVRTRLWNLFETAISSNNIQYHEAAERLSLVHFYYQLEGLMEANMKLASQLKEKIMAPRQKNE